MTFTEWYKDTYNDEWHEDYAWLGRLVMKTTEEYENWCKENNQETVWDG